MDAEFENKLVELREALLQPAATLMAKQQMKNSEIKFLTKESYGFLHDAYWLIYGVIGAALSRVNEKTFDQTPKDFERNALFSSFVIGLDICRTAIENGVYLQAACLLRQEMEMLAQMKGVNKEGKKQKANLKLLENSISRLYGELSKAAHATCSDILFQATVADPITEDELNGLAIFTRFYPELDEEVAHRLFSLHILLMREVAIEILGDHSKREGCGHTNQDMEAIDMIIRLLKIEGMDVIDGLALSEGVI